MADQDHREHGGPERATDLPHDPALAAEHLSALTLGQVNNKSMMGTVQLSDAEADQIISSGIAAFLRAYGPAAR